MSLFINTYRAVLYQPNTKEFIMSIKQDLKHYLYALMGVILLVLADQYTKLLAVQKLKSQDPFVILKGIFELQYLENRGMAFGLMQLSLIHI